MRLMEYRKSETSDLVDALFLDDEEHFWHLQLVDGNTPNRPGVRPRIQFEIQDEPPEIGVVAEGYKSVQEGGTTPLLRENTWLELMLLAMNSRGGWEAMVRIVL